MKTPQGGLSSFGALIVLAIAVAVGYYAYKAVSGGDEEPSCGGAFNACMQKCRRTATETAAAQACQEACRRDVEECNRRSR